MKYLNITYPDLENGCGCRVTLWVAGCSHHCLGCHNPETWNFDNGNYFDYEAKINLFKFLELPYIKGITLSGGDPMYYNNLNGVLSLCEDIKKNFPDKDIWLYTGYTYEQLINDVARKEILQYVDVLVDGPFVLERRDVSLPFRGSSNQRIIDVKKSLKEHKLILWD